MKRSEVKEKDLICSNPQKTILTPTTPTAIINVAKTFRKQILPLYSTWSPRPLKESIWCGKKPLALADIYSEMHDFRAILIQDNIHFWGFFPILSLSDSHLSKVTRTTRCCFQFQVTFVWVDFTEQFKPKSGNASTHKNWQYLITFTKTVRIFFELKRALDTDK